MKKKYKIIAIITIFIIANIVSFLIVLKRRENLNKEYPQIQFEDCYTGKVLHFFINGGLYLEISNNGLIKLRVDARNQENKSLASYIMIGDYFTKPCNSDSIFISRGNHSEFFIIY